MKYLNKLWQIITKDVSNDNELKKPAVIIRCTAVVMVFYGVISAVLMFCLKLNMPFIVSLIFVAGYSAVFYLAYNNSTKTCYFLEMILTLGWVIINVSLFGFNIGVQYFLILLIQYSFVTSHIRNLYKYLISMFITLVFLVLYFYSRRFIPLLYINEAVTDVLQTLNIFFACFLEATIISLFSSDSLMQEEKLMEYNRRVTHLASIDPLTGLINRRSTKEQIANLIEAGREEVPFISLAMGDIDFFKKVNDTYGHEGGDEVLKGLSKCFLEETENIGLVCRWGGEEFLFILPNMNGDEAYEFIEKLRRKVKTITFTHNDAEFNVSMTFGLQEHDFRDSIDTSIDNADRKLYIGKSSGRDQVVY